MKRPMLTAICLIALLASCESTDDMRIRAMIGGGPSNGNAEFGGAEGTMDGGQGSLRVEWARQPDYVDNVDVGVRILAGFHDIYASDRARTLTVDTLDLGVIAVVRPYVDLSEASRLYFEGFGGYRHSWGDIELLGGMGILSDSGSDGGVLYGFGVGVELANDPNNSLILGLEWSRNLLGDGGLDLDLDDFTFLTGWSFSF
jgi:hypothetical protein